jgi:hypothetical protein
LPRILKITDLEARKRALIQESDVYRESLKLQFQNLGYCLARTRHQFKGLTGFGVSTNPWLNILSPLMDRFLKGRGLPGMRVVTSVILAWKMLRRFRFILPFFRRRKKKAERRQATAAV